MSIIVTERDMKRIATAIRRVRPKVARVYPIADISDVSVPLTPKQRQSATAIYPIGRSPDGFRARYRDGQYYISADTVSRVRAIDTNTPSEYVLIDGDIFARSAVEGPGVIALVQTEVDLPVRPFKVFPVSVYIDRVRGNEMVTGLAIGCQVIPVTVNWQTRLLAILRNNDTDYESRTVARQTHAAIATMYGQIVLPVLREKVAEARALLKAAK